MNRDQIVIDIARAKSPRRSRADYGRSHPIHSERVPTILLVDDDLAVRSMLQRKLRSNGWQVQCAATPEDALLFLNESVPDVLITELSTGTVSGWDLLYHETLERPTLPIFVVSALPAGAVYGADRFARQYFQKPLDVDRLLVAVRCCLGEKAIS